MCLNSFIQSFLVHDYIHFLFSFYFQTGVEDPEYQYEPDDGSSPDVLDPSPLPEDALMLPNEKQKAKLLAGKLAITYNRALILVSISFTSSHFSCFRVTCTCKNDITFVVITLVNHS